MPRGLEWWIASNYEAVSYQAMKNTMTEAQQCRRQQYFLLLILFFAACGGGAVATVRDLPSSGTAINESTTIEPAAGATPETTYEGKSIDELFPEEARFSSIEGKDTDKGKHELSIGGYSLEFDDFRPLVLRTNKKTVFSFQTKYKKDYWSLGAGVAHLLGQNSRQIYVGNTGPGGVCCSNYWIVDMTGNQPRLIFSTEEWGGFRDAIEIFDTDDDGTYELAHFDSCFRYIFDDCGTCTPEPRVAWRYDVRTRRYLPAKHLMQGFARAELDQEKNSLKAPPIKPGESDDLREAYDRRRTALDVFAQLMHLGVESEAWTILNKYYKPSKKELAEINQRLAACPYYQFLHGRTKRNADNAAKHN
jgi:hypothetical protein